MKKLNELGFGITISTKKYYWILYYSFLSPKACENDQVVLIILLAHNFGVTKRNFMVAGDLLFMLFECFLKLQVTYREIAQKLPSRFLEAAFMVWYNRSVKISAAARTYLHQSKHSRYFFNTSECCSNPIAAMDREMLAALWVYADFADRTEYHSAGEFPVKILFFADAIAFDIIYVPEGREILINCASEQLDDESKRLVIVETVEQIDLLDIPNTAAYCLVNLHSGEIQYFTMEDSEEE